MTACICRGTRRLELVELGEKGGGASGRLFRPPSPHRRSWVPNSREGRTEVSSEQRRRVGRARLDRRRKQRSVRVQRIDPPHAPGVLVPRALSIHGEKARTSSGLGLPGLIVSQAKRPRSIR
jgi:hypothetical protein